MKYMLIFLLIAFGAFAHNYHGCTLAPDNLHGWVVCLDTVLILHTTDGGATWQSQNVSDSVNRFFDVTCIDQFNAWTCGILGEILHTDNGGLDWYGQAIGLSKYATRVEFIDQDYGWAACGDGTVAITIDGGSFWDYSAVPPYNYEFYGVSFVNQWDGWVVSGYPDSLLTGQGCIFRSTDGGWNWDSLYQASSYEDLFDVHFFNLFDGIIVGGDETDYSPIIMKTIDGGLSWNPISTPTNTYYLRAVDFVGNEGWAVGRLGSIIHSTNSGNTWTFQTNPATNTLFDVDFSDNLHGIACGQNIILYTMDGGQTWLPTGIEEQQKIEPQVIALEVYPNPFREKTAIRYSPAPPCGARPGILDTGFWKGEGEQNISESVGSISGYPQPVIKIYDVTGRCVKTFNHLTIQPSNYSTIKLSNQVSWDGTDDLGYKAGSGIYFINLDIDNYRQAIKVILLK